MTLEELNGLAKQVEYANNKVKILTEIRESNVHSVFLKSNLKLSPINTKSKEPVNVILQGHNYQSYSKDESNINNIVLSCLYFHHEKLDDAIKEAKDCFDVLNSQYQQAISVLNTIRIKG